MTSSTTDTLLRQASLTSFFSVETSDDKKRKADEAIKTIERDDDTSSSKKPKTQTAKEFLATLTTQFPQYKFRVNKSGKWVERARGDGQYRRACVHGRFAIECMNSDCTAAYASDKSVVRRKVSVKAVPIQSNPLAGREHAEAPVIPFNGDIVKARRRMEKYLEVWRRVPNEKLGSDCIFSTGATYKTGQGAINFDGRNLLSHVFAWMVRHGREVPDGFKILHKCSNGGNHGCSQELHLEIGTHRQNMFEDKLRDGTLHFGETHHRASMVNQKALVIYNSKGNGTRHERALRFGVKLSTVKKIDSGETWGLVTGKHNARIKERERVYKKNQNRSRSDATPADYEKAMKRIEAHNYPSGNAKGCTYSTYCRDICGYPLTSILGHQTRCSILTYEYYWNKCKVKPKDLWVLHKCDDEHCTNKDHLELGTPTQNQLDRWARTGFKRIHEEEKASDEAEDDVEESGSDVEDVEQDEEDNDDEDADDDDQDNE